jgi:hypothetical protein
MLESVYHRRDSDVPTGASVEQCHLSRHRGQSKEPEHGNPDSPAKHPNGFPSAP